jgi:hypothetical protein
MAALAFRPRPLQVIKLRLDLSDAHQLQLQLVTILRNAYLELIHQGPQADILPSLLSMPISRARFAQSCGRHRGSEDGIAELDVISTLIARFFASYETFFGKSPSNRFVPFSAAILATDAWQTPRDL